MDGLSLSRSTLASDVLFWIGLPQSNLSRLMKKLGLR